MFMTYPEWFIIIEFKDASIIVAEFEWVFIVVRVIAIVWYAKWPFASYDGGPFVGRGWNVDLESMYEVSLRSVDITEAVTMLWRCRSG